MMHYNKTLFCSKSLSSFAKLYLRGLPPDVTVLVSRGSSGCAIASAMLALSERELYHVYVRKPGEEGHSDRFAGTYYMNPEDKEKEHIGCIVDDFVSSGYTVEMILENFHRNESRVGHISIRYVLVYTAHSREACRRIMHVDNVRFILFESGQPCYLKRDMDRMMNTNSYMQGPPKELSQFTIGGQYEIPTSIRRA